MKRITALLHVHRMSDIVHALEAAGERRISILHAHGLLQAATAREQNYSVELGERMTQEIQLDVFCDDAKVEELVDLIRRHGRTGQMNSGWIFVAPVEDGLPIDRERPGRE
jgi:nitrogen regulatory protein P-II 1